MPPARRILMTADAVGGVWNYALDLASAMAQEDADVLLAVMGPHPTSEQIARAGRISNLELICRPFKLEWMEEPWADVARAGEWLLELESAYQPHVIHLNGYCHAELKWHAPVLVVAHSCVLSWWQSVKGDAAPPEWQTYRDHVARGLRSAQMVVAPSFAMLSAIQDLYGALPHAAVVPNGRARAHGQAREKEPFVLTAGRLWDEAKNVRLLEQVSPSISWPVYAAGQSRKSMGTSPQNASLRFLGILDSLTLAEWMARASIFVSPALYEPFGLSVLEAALSECALVLSDIPSFREIWQGTAAFFPPGDAGALQNILAALIDDPERRRRLASKAHDRALAFSPDRMACEYLKIYRNLTCAS